MDKVRDQYKTSPVQYSSVSARSRGRPANRGKGYTPPESSRSRQMRNNVPANHMNMGDYEGDQTNEYQDEYYETSNLYPSLDTTRDIDELHSYIQVLDSKIESMSAMLKEMHGWLLSMKVNQSTPTGVPVAPNMSSVGRIVKST